MQAFVVRNPMRRSRALLLATGFTLPLAFLACGSRTGLLGGSVDVPGSPDALPLEGSTLIDGSIRPDSTAFDALPGIDVQRDAPRPPPVGCVDAGDTQIYLITSENGLLSFYPPTGVFTTIGNIACPSAPGTTPFSMGVARSGTAFTVFTDGRLYRVSTATAACTSTPFAVGQSGFTTFGMGFVGDQAGENLYVTDNVGGRGLATINTTSFNLAPIGTLRPALPERCELTGTGASELFAYCIDSAQSGGVIAQIDRQTARVIAANRVNVGDVNNAFAFAFWGGDFYMFNSAGEGSGTTVTKYDPATRAESVVATHPLTIVGAGVSTCAPN
jgi:hypothetical protein